jgi:murein DD-endopeptidase MepM/ murein hydrolase activator NlpD
MLLQGFPAGFLLGCTFWLLNMKITFTPLFPFVFLLLLLGCSRRDDPCEVIQVRPLASFHIVKDGETIPDIASRYGMTTQEFCRINALNVSSLLITGQRVFIIPQGGNNAQSHRAATIVEVNQAPFPESPADFPGETIATGETGAAGTAWNSSDSSTSSATSALALPGKTAMADEREAPFEKLEYSEPGLEAGGVGGPSAKQTDIQLIWPITGRILRRFHEKLPNGSLSEGINISAPADVAVKACADGEVLDAGELVLGFGKMVILVHDRGIISIYGHLQEITLERPKKGRKVAVKKGQVIGRVGKTGNVRAPQLHFQLRNENKEPIDPLLYLPD